MYRALAWTLGTFVTLFTTLTIAMLAADGSHEQSWQWKWEWTQVVSWEVRNTNMINCFQLYHKVAFSDIDELPVLDGQVGTVALSSMFSP